MSQRPETALPTRRWLARLAIATIFVVSLAAIPARAEEAGTPRSAAQLEQQVAPIALYPDPLLAQILMASTYPQEVVEAERWTQANSDLSGEARLEALQKEPWEASVKGLTAIPQTLQMMADQPDWMQALGDAFLARQQAVLDAIQRLRTRADAAGNLETTPQHKVSRVAAPPSPDTVYTIEPPTVDEYYLPLYDAKAAYGRWPYTDYPPFTWFPPGHVADGVLSFAGGVAVGSAIWGRIDWWNHRVNININRFNRFNHTSIKRIAWVHDPAHRGNVPYREPGMAARLADQAKSDQAKSASAREGSSDRADADRREDGERAKSDDDKSDSGKSAKSKRSRSERSARSERQSGGSRGGKRRGRRR
jgi:hypothetical protein